MATEAELTNRLREILSNSDLNTTTTANVRRKLEEDFGIDLSDKKVFIREQIDLYLQSQVEDAGEEEEEAEDEENEELEEEFVSKSRKCKVAPKKKRSKKGDNNVVKKRGGGGFTKPSGLSPELQKITGEPELSRTEVVKKLWGYIREHNLQDPANRQNIVCDDALRELFNVDTINMFQMNKSLTKHIWPLDSTCDASSSAAKEKKRKQDAEEDSEVSNRKEKRQKSANSDSEESNKKEKKQKSANSGFHAPIALSEPLMKFFGTGETALARSDVIKKMWDYIKQNNLQDPSDRRNILCDEKLQELFSVDQFRGFTMAKLLKDHFIKKEQ